MRISPLRMLISNPGSTTLLMGAIAIGSLIGLTAPSLGLRLGSYIDHTVVALVAMLFFELHLGSLRIDRSDARFLAIAWSANFLVIPFIGFGLASIVLPSQPLFAAGLTIYFMAPCTDWFLGFTRLAGGNTSLGSLLLPLNMITQLALFPLYLTIFTHWKTDFDLHLSTRSLFEWLIVPVGIALLARTAIKVLGAAAARDRAGSAIAGAIPLVIAALVVEIFALNAPTIAENLSGFARVLAAVFFFFVVTCLLGDCVSRLFRLDYPEHVLLTMTTAAWNAPLMLGVTMAAIPDQPLIYAALIIGMLVEFPHLTLLKHLVMRKRKEEEVQVEVALHGLVAE